MQIILASGSPRRRELLAEMGLTFDIIKPDIDETQSSDESPLAYVRRLSQEKAQAVADHINQQPALILAADTVVILAADTIGITDDGEILGKPETDDDARQMLTRLRNRTHQVCTAFTLLRTSDNHRHTQHVITAVTMRDYTADEIDAYIATGDPFDKAGSYAIQHAEFNPVARINGSYANVVGLPVDEVRAALATFGI